MVFRPKLAASYLRRGPKPGPKLAAAYFSRKRNCPFILMFATYLSRGLFKSRLIFARIDGSIVVLHEHFAPKRHRLDGSCGFYKLDASTDKKTNMVMLYMWVLYNP